MSDYKDLQVEPSVLRPSLLLASGQTFTWRQGDKDTWYGIISDAVYEIKQESNTTRYRCLHGICSEDKVRHFFDLNHEYKILEDATPPAVKKILDQRRGIRILNQSLLEVIVAFICSANNNIKRITRLISLLQETYGTFLCSHHTSGRMLKFHTFPNLKQLKAASIQELQRLGFGYRSRYIVKTVATIDQLGQEWLDELKGLDDEHELSSQLQRLPGVGRKVADCIMLFGLERRNTVPVDVHINKIAQDLLGIKKSKKSLDDKQYKEIVKAFRRICPMDAGWLQAVLFIDSVSNGDAVIT